MKKKIIFVIFCLFLFNINIVCATSGALRKSSIKTCPNGITYGYHGSNKHWHVAEKFSKSSSGWVAVGDSISKDPCPNLKTTSNTSTKTSSSSITKTAKKSNDTLISKIIINNDEITNIQDEMNYNSTSKKINIKVILHDYKATYSINGDISKIYAEKINTFEIIVIAEDGTNKIYKLLVTREPLITTDSILNLKVNDNNVYFDKNNSSNISLSYDNNKLNIIYEASNKNDELQIFENGERVDLNKEITIGNHKYDLKLIDEFGDIKLYNIEVERYSKSKTISDIVISIIVFGIVAGIILLIKRKRS